MATAGAVEDDNDDAVVVVVGGGAAACCGDNPMPIEWLREFVIDG